jgi:hypothetical protein
LTLMWIFCNPELNSLRIDDSSQLRISFVDEPRVVGCTVFMSPKWWNANFATWQAAIP